MTMASRTFAATPKAIQKLCAKGRGQGHGAQYQPWLSVRDVPSCGQVNRIRGHTTTRVHHFLSQLELLVFYAMDLAPSITDIREQYPLLPIEETWAIAQACGIAHPLHPRTRRPIVLTSDFLLTKQMGLKEQNLVRSVKYAKHLEKPRTLEKLELERRYWMSRHMDWGIVTEQEIPPALAKNLAWLHPCYDRSVLASLSPDTICRLAQELTETVMAQRVALRTAASTCDALFTLPPGYSLTLARHLIATRQWSVDLHVLIEPSQPLAISRTTIHAHQLSGAR